MNQRWLPIAIVLFIAPQLTALDYDPLTVDFSVKVQSLTFTVQDSSRHREIPIRVYFAEDSDSRPVVLFSHGLGGTRDGNRYLAEHWARRGYVAVFLQHPGSDDSVWRNTPLRSRMTALCEAASFQNLSLRCEDVSSVLDQLSQWNGLADHPLYGRLDLGHIGMSGHSFGAHTTQAVAGQSFPLIGQKYLDNRIDAAIAFSPSSPPRGDKAAAFARVEVPWMLMTGTEDRAPIGNQTVESRLEVYPNLPSSIAKYELVLFDAEHSAFSERPLPGDTKPRNPNHHRVILALSTAFLDAYLKHDPVALQWLTGIGPTPLFEARDRWQHQP